MTKIETDHVTVNKPAKEVFQFLIDFNNFEKLLPADKIENWSSTEKECSFRIKGMANIGMEIIGKEEFSIINIVSKGKVPFDFKLDIYLENSGDNISTTYFIFSGEINAFMKMMVEQPLTNFFNMLVNNLSKFHA